MKNPVINIEHGWLLERAFVRYMEMIPELKEKLEERPTKERTGVLIKARQEIWSRHSDLILSAMQEVTGLTFARDIIDAYIVFGYKGGFSHPLVIGIMYKEHYFVDFLTHELIHVLLGGNNENIDEMKWIEKRFPEVTNSSVKNHILVHAVHKEIYLEHLKVPERFKEHSERAQAHQGYKESWDIVEKIGHKEIIAMFKADNNLK